MSRASVKNCWTLCVLYASLFLGAVGLRFLLIVCATSGVSYCFGRASRATENWIRGARGPSTRFCASFDGDFSAGLRCWRCDFFLPAGESCAQTAEPASLPRMDNPG